MLNDNTDVKTYNKSVGTKHHITISPLSLPSQLGTPQVAKSANYSSAGDT